MPHVLDLKNLKKESSPAAASNAAARGTFDVRTFDGAAAGPEKKMPREAYLSWEADEYDYRPKKLWWFAALGAITLGLFAFAVFAANYFFAAFIAIAGAVVGWFARRKPRRLHFSITEEGVQLGRRLYLFEDLKSFWIFYDPPLFKELSLESRKTLMPRVRAPLGEAAPEKIRQALLAFLPEKKQNESIIALLSKLVGF